MRSEGYGTWSVCLSVCLSVCVSTLILALQATKLLMSDTNGFSATRARKSMWRNARIRERTVVVQRRLCTRHRLHRVRHRFVWSPTQPSQPADSALCQNCTLALPRLQVFSMVNAGTYTQSRNSKSLPVLKSR